MLTRIIICLLLLIPYYFPMFGKIVPAFEGIFRFNYAKYSMIFFVVSCAYAVIRNGTIRRLDGAALGLFVLNGYVVLDMLSKAWWVGGFQGGINLSAGFILSTFVIIYISQLPEFGRDHRLFETLAMAIGVMATLQVAISAYESWSGALLGHYDVDMVATELSSRDVLQLLGGDQQRLFGFSFPFTGLIGQHNGFGIMLVFYNAFFLLAYECSRRPVFLLFIPVVLVGLIGNGTRSAIVLTLLLDLGYFYLMQRKVSLKIISGVAGFMVMMVIGPQLLQRALDFYFQANSLQVRLDLWNSILSQYFPPEGFRAFLFGLDFEEITFIGADQSRQGTSISVENEFLRLYLYTGIFGFLGFTLLMAAQLFRRAQSNAGETGGGLRLLVFSIFFMGMFMTGITYYATYVLITLSLLMVRHHELLAAAHPPLYASGRPQSRLVHNKRSQRLFPVRG